MVNHKRLEKGALQQLEKMGELSGGGEGLHSQLRLQRLTLNAIDKPLLGFQGAGGVVVSPLQGHLDHTTKECLVTTTGSFVYQ